MSLATAIINPYWDTIRDHATNGQVDPYPWPAENNSPRRTALTDRYAWTITDPATVAFVAEHLNGLAIDPLAGTGYWAYLLGQAGVEVVASDHQPPNETTNHYHHAGVTHTRVKQDDAIKAVARRCAGWSLFLAWPPYDEPTGTNIIRAYEGDRIVYVGEGYGGCCGDDAMFELLGSEWVQVAEHRPVQFAGIHDFVTVYDRRAGGL
ncbi:hypothetical protein ABT336_14480 [Micromonospora sp. NPDC000207]|uniref:hypothetical protein n=1 Tax=Micromonospora sp. NPDC000207 TaxID=3154246 RepID=UPI0033332A70